MVKKIIIAFSLVVALFGVAACGGSGEDGDDGSKQSDKQQSKSSSEPDLSGIPSVVAEVNGKKVEKQEFVEAYKAQFQQMAMQAQSTGQAPDQDKLKKQVAENLVSTELLVQEADKQHLAASQKEMDKTLDGLAKQNGMKSGDQVISAMKKQGMAEDQIMSDLKTQVKVDKLISKETGSVEPSTKELKAMYKQMVAQQKQQGGGKKGQKVPSFEKMRPQLEQQVKSQKESKAAQTLVSKLRKDADVTVHL